MIDPIMEWIATFPPTVLWHSSTVRGLTIPIRTTEPRTTPLAVQPNGVDVAPFEPLGWQQYTRPFHIDGEQYFLRVVDVIARPAWPILTAEPEPYSMLPAYERWYGWPIQYGIHRIGLLHTRTPTHPPAPALERATDYWLCHAVGAGLRPLDSP